MKLDLQRAAEDLGDVGGASPSRARELVTKTLVEVDRLEQAVSASLRIARSGSGTFDALDARVPLQFGGERRGAPSRAARRLARRGTAGGVPLSVYGDVAALTQLFSNVLNNAVEAARSTVRVSTEAVNGTLRVRFQDDGAGLSDAALAHIGEPFYSTKPGGTGLGLVIAERVAAAHRGEIVVRSAVGEGTTVEVVFART